ncbi:MAG: MFS transporter [Candidatus Bathyarchaeota archaeon]|nr:MFS transporter [Candidatus Bathyarchaeota archaeon]MDH5733235.1 MFS transporter [Candidatus Bathyarchaeota archaeon]
MGLTDFLKQEFSFITGNYRILVISWVIMDLAMEMPNPNFQKYVVETLQGPDMALGLIGLANFLAMAAVAFPGGYLADKYGRRWLITTMTFGMALSWLFFAFAPTWHFILLGSIVSSLCLIYQPALFAMVQDSLPPERRGMGSSIIQLIHGTFNTPGPIFAGFLLWQFGLEWSMRIIYLLMTTLYVTAALWRLRLRETITNGEPIRFRYFISSYPKATRESINVWKKVPKSMFWLFVVQILVTFGMSLTQVINQLYAVDVLGITLEQWWLVFIPLLLTMVVASIPIGKTVDVFGRKLPLILGLCVLGTAELIFAYGDFLTIMISMVLFGIAQLLIMSSAMALATDLVDPVNRGKVVGFRNFVRYIMMGFGMLLGNYFFIQGKGMNLPQLPFYIALGLVVPALLVILFLVHEPEERVGMLKSVGIS